MWTLYWVYGLVDRSLRSRLIQPCRMCTAVCAACSRATSARNSRTSAIRDSVSVMALVFSALPPPGGGPHGPTPESEYQPAPAVLHRTLDDRRVPRERPEPDAVVQPACLRMPRRPRAR